MHTTSKHVFLQICKSRKISCFFAEAKNKKGFFWGSNPQPWAQTLNFVFRFFEYSRYTYCAIESLFINSLVNTNNCMSYRCKTPILWSSSFLLVQSRPVAFKAIIICVLELSRKQHRPRREKTCLLGFRQSEIKTSLFG